MTKPIPTTAKRVARLTLESLKDTDKEITLSIRIPTPTERDKIGARLYELGVTQISQETVRATLIDELFRVDWSQANDKPTAYDLDDADQRAKFNEERAEEYADFLDGYWQRSEIDQMATARWQEQEVQRILDEANGADPRDPEPQPAKSISTRDHAKAKLLVDDMMERSQRLRTLAARQLDYNRSNASMMARMHILDIEPKDPKNWPVKLQRVDDLLTIDTIDQLREHIGDKAWMEIIDNIDGHYVLGEDEEKNSDSPLEKPSDQTGSHAPSGASEASDGKSTDSSITPVPTGESETTTGKSSASTSGAKGKK